MEQGVGRVRESRVVFESQISSRLTIIASRHVL